MKAFDLFKLFLSLLLCQSAGFIGALFTTPNIPVWYNSLVKPGFTPPGTVFGPVWTALYLLMGIAFYLVWIKGLNDNRVKAAAIVFLVQLFLNILWSIVFFGLRSPLGGVVVIVLLWFAILLTIYRFYYVSIPAAFLLAPYLLWVSFAAVLNFSIAALNMR